MRKTQKQHTEYGLKNLYHYDYCHNTDDNNDSEQ